MLLLILAASCGIFHCSMWGSAVLRHVQPNSLSPALQGGFLTAGPSGKSLNFLTGLLVLYSHSCPYSPSPHSSRMILPHHQSDPMIDPVCCFKSHPCQQVSNVTGNLHSMVYLLCLPLYAPSTPHPLSQSSPLSYPSPPTIFEPHLPSFCSSKYMCSCPVYNSCKHSFPQFFTWLTPF